MVRQIPATARADVPQPRRLAALRAAALARGDDPRNPPLRFAPRLRHSPTRRPLARAGGPGLRAAFLNDHKTAGDKTPLIFAVMGIFSGAADYHEPSAKDAHRVTPRGRRHQI